MVDLVYDPQLETDSKRLRELKALKYHRLSQEPHRYYEPIGKFDEFIKKSMSGDYRVSLFEAANGVGKTFGMVNLLANLFWNVDNKYFQEKLFQDWKYEKRGRIVSYPNTVTETIIPALKAVFPKNRYNIGKYEMSKEGKRYEAVWVTDTGWTFTIMTYDQDVQEFESANLGFVWEDEPPSIQIHRANYSRLRMGGVLFVTETPLKGSQWIFDEFINKKPTDLQAEKKSVTTAVLEDACVEHGENGFLNHQQILDQVAGYDKDELQSRVFGKHSHLSGLVFKKWTPDIHIIKPFNITYEDYVVVEALDPHPRVNDAVLWVAIDRFGKKYMIEELWGSFETAELAARIKDVEKNYRIVKRLIDPSAFNVDKHTGYCLAADLESTYHLSFEPGSKARTDAIQKIRENIDFQANESGIYVPPALHSFDTVEQANWEISRWQWQDWRGLTAQFKDPKEKPIDKDDHMIENLGRILLADVQFEEIMYETPIPTWAQGRPVRTGSKALNPYE